MERKRRVAVLGLDALNRAYLDKMTSSGYAPALARIAGRGSCSTLIGVPPVTPPSWASIMTGVNPGKHGIFGFFNYEKPSLKQRLYTALDLKHPRIHEMLSLRGVRSVVFNPIPDYPLLPARHAVVVSNLFFTPKPVSSPPEAYRRFFGNVFPERLVRSSDCRAVQEYESVLEIYLSAVEEVTVDPPGLFWVNMNVPDVLFHRCSQILGEKLVAGEHRIINLLDKLVGKLSDVFDALFIVSDHGFSSYKGQVLVNDALVSAKLAYTGPYSSVRELSEYNVGERAPHVSRPKRVRVPPSIYKTAKKPVVSVLARILLKAYSAVSGRKVVVDSGLHIDTERSKALCPDSFSFGVYLKRPELLETVLEAINSSGLPLRALPSKEFYWGPYVSEGPDIVILPLFEQGYKLRCNVYLGLGVARGRYFDHHPHGVLLAYGFHIPESRLPNYAVAPLVLQAMGEPQPSTADYRIEGPRENYLARWSLALRARGAIS